MNHRIKRCAAGALALVTAASVCLTGCGSGNADEGAAGNAATQYTWLLSAGESSVYYEEYEDNPVYKYWADMTWDVDGESKQISIDFTTPPSGSEKDNMNTLIATGDYMDVLSTSYLSDSVASLYEEGMILDLTDYVAEYMPNYTARMNEDPRIASQLTNTVDGEKKILQIYGLADEASTPYCGFEYRRDWIVKYGSNPETGEAFTGSWNEDKTVWTDDVVFPSGGSDPVYISDWEWMLDIFATALKEEGITDGYVMQLPYQGYFGVGDFSSGFGVSGMYYLDENGKCQFGGDSDAFRASVECLSNWYEKGWIDETFEENSSDAIFWRVDEPTVHAGKVGLWYGLNSSLGAQMENTDGNTDDPLSGIVVYGAAQPINDVYGDASCQNVTPAVGFGTSVIGSSIVLTDKMADKDIGALLTAIDYLYSDEGSLLDRGLSDEQQEEVQDAFYQEYGLDGAYTIDGNTLVVNQKILAQTDLESATRMVRLVDYQRNANVDMNYADYYQHGLDQWTKYNFSGTVSSAVEGQMTGDQSSEVSLNKTNIMTYMSQAIPNFVTGREDVTDDASWENYCKEVDSYDPQTYCTYINEVLGNN